MNFNTLKKHRKCGSDSDDEKQELVERIDNSIYFYDEVNRKSVLKLMICLKETTNEIQKKLYDTGGSGIIYLHICSFGGSVFEGFAAMDVVKSNPIPVTTVIEGVVCSAATFMALGGAQVTMRPSAHMLIHQMSSCFWGKYDDFNDEKQTLDKLMNVLRKMYSKHTSIPGDILADMFRRDIYIDFDECLKWKVIDSVFGKA
jgi:ATP-dependent protease ClpP protease subunit